MALESYSACVLRQVNLQANGALEHPMWILADPMCKKVMLRLNTTNQLFVEVGVDTSKFIVQQPDFSNDSSAGEP